MHHSSENIALVWDLGAGSAHAVKQHRIALGLQERGHNVLLLARNLRAVSDSARALGLPLLQAPHNDWFPEAGAPASFADILCNEVGLHDARQTIALFDAWCALLERLQCSRVIVEGAPLAIAAAHRLGIATAAYGTGFMLPPGPPWPVFRDWEAIDARALQSREARIQTHLELAGSRIDDLQASDQALLTWAPFDHYPQRRDGRYFGPLVSAAAVGPEWLEQRPRIFAYLHGHYPGLTELLAALGATAADTLAVISGAPELKLPARVRRANGLVDLDQALGDCDLVVSHGGNVVVSAAAAGKPVLVLPLQAEQYITARRLVEHGVGLAITAGFDAPDYLGALRRLLGESQFRTRAQALDASLPRWDRAQQLDAVLDLLLGKTPHATPRA